MFTEVEHLVEEELDNVYNPEDTCVFMDSGTVIETPKSRTRTTYYKRWWASHWGRRKRAVVVLEIDLEEVKETKNFSESVYCTR